MTPDQRLTAEAGRPLRASVSGRATPGTFATDGPLPAGLALNLARGTVEGVAPAPGVYYFRIAQPAPHPSRLIELRVFPTSPAAPESPTVPQVIPVVHPVLPASRAAPRPTVRPPAPSPLADFFELAKPCPEPGCAELRARYKESLDKLTGTGCSACALSALKQKYAHEYRRLLVRV